MISEEDINKVCSKIEKKEKEVNSLRWSLTYNAYSKSNTQEYVRDQWVARLIFVPLMFLLSTLIFLISDYYFIKYDTFFAILSCIFSFLPASFAFMSAVIDHEIHCKDKYVITDYFNPRNYYDFVNLIIPAFFITVIVFFVIMLTIAGINSLEIFTPNQSFIIIMSVLAMSFFSKLYIKFQKDLKDKMTEEELEEYKVKKSQAKEQYECANIKLKNLKSDFRTDLLSKINTLEDYMYLEMISQEKGNSFINNIKTEAETKISSCYNKSIKVLKKERIKEMLHSDLELSNI